MLQDLAGMCETETEQDWPLLILLPALLKATEAVTALLSSDNRWANGPVTRLSPACTLQATDAHGTPLQTPSPLAGSGIYLKQYLLSRGSTI